MNKQIVFIALVIFFFASCKNNYKAENEYLDCFYSFYENKGIDIKSTINKIEDIFVANDVLKDRTGESYLKVFQHISTVGAVSENDDKMVLELNMLGDIPQGVVCNKPEIFNMLIRNFARKEKVHTLWENYLT